MISREIDNLLASVEDWIVARAVHFARRWPTVSADDFAQEGRIRAWRCAKNFDASRGVPFLAYAKVSIDFSMRSCAEKFARPVRVPVHRFHTTPHQYESLDCLTAVLEDGGMELAAERLDGILAVDGDAPFGETQDADNLVALTEALDKLTQKERDVLRWRFGRGERLWQIGERLGVCRERVRQIEAHALRKLRRRVFFTLKMNGYGKVRQRELPKLLLNDPYVRMK